MKREIKFRAWVKYRTDNRWEWAYSEAEKLRLEYDETAEKRDLFLYQWDKEHPQEDRYSYKEYMTNLDEVSISLSGKLVRLINLEVLDIMQFTGLHDKNGKEIYEGDILVLRTIFRGKFVPYQDNWVVDFQRGGFLLTHCDPKTLSTEGYRLHDIPFNDPCREIEVIGNIYEHSHILGDKNA